MDTTRLQRRQNTFLGEHAEKLLWAWDRDRDPQKPPASRLSATRPWVLLSIGLSLNIVNISTQPKSFTRAVGRTLFLRYLSWYRPSFITG